MARTSHALHAPHVRTARRIALTITAAALFCALGGCAAQSTHVNHPGAANTFDSSTYDSLLVTHNVIEATKTDLAGGVFPVTIAPSVKTALNNLVQAYNVADAAYRVYHAAAVAGTATQAQATAVSDAVQNVNNTTAALSAAKAGS